MRRDQSLIVARRAEPGLVNCWGIYSDQHRRWLDVIFASEREAREALQILLGVH